MLLGVVTYPQDTQLCLDGAIGEWLLLAYLCPHPIEDPCDSPLLVTSAAKTHPPSIWPLIVWRFYQMGTSPLQRAPREFRMTRFETNAPGCLSGYPRLRLDDDPVANIHVETNHSIRPILVVF